MEEVRISEQNEIPVPKEKFYQFYPKFDTVSELMQDEQWKTVFSHYYQFDELEEEIEIHETSEEINSYGPERQQDEIIKCANSFSYFCHKYVKITHPVYGLLPFCMFKYQHRVIENYTTNRFNILSKFRQGGLTTVSVIWALWRCLFKTDQRILVMSKTDREAIAAGEIAKDVISYLPDWLKPETDKNNEHEKQFIETGSILWCYTPEAARGKSITLLIIDEAAFISDMNKHWKAMYPVIATGGACCVVSTVNGTGNWYEEMYHEAEAGKNPFNIIELDYWEHPDYNDPVWVEDTKANLGEKGWQQEVLRSFLGSGDTFIPTNIIAELKLMTQDNQPSRVAFEKWKNKTRERSEELLDGALWIFKEPVDGHEYIIGADCAEGVGSEGDNSAMEIIDQGTMEQVAEFYSNTVPPHVFAQIINQLGYFYNTALVVVENKGQGAAVLGLLLHDLGYDNIFYDNKGRQQVPGFKTGKDNRHLFLETLQNRLMTSSFKVTSRRLVKELETFYFNPRTKKPEAQRGRHDDAIMSIAMALYVRDSLSRSMPIGSAKTEELQMFKAEVMEDIKKEIMRDAPENWLLDLNDDKSFIEEEREVDDSMIFTLTHRRNAKLLQEFGW